MSRFRGDGHPIIIWSEYLGHPGIGVTATEEWRCAIILVKRGKGALRDEIRNTVRFPGPAIPEGEELSAETAFRVQLCRDDLADGWDLAAMDAAPNQFDETDRMITGWLENGELPGFEEMCFELAWPYFLKRITDWAERELGQAAEAAFEHEEVAAHRVKRWLTAVDPFREHDWLPRAELFARYTDWCRMDQSGSDAGQPRDFYRALRELGFPEAGRNGERGFRTAKRRSQP